MKNNYKQTLQDKCKRIKIVLTDVDGVLTNSDQYFSGYQVRHIFLKYFLFLGYSL